jgi:hypothetical protein
LAVVVRGYQIFKYGRVVMNIRVVPEEVQFPSCKYCKKDDEKLVDEEQFGETVGIGLYSAFCSSSKILRASKYASVITVNTYSITDIHGARRKGRENIFFNTH